jgi:outer membrane lipoprotein LolB
VNLWRRTAGGLTLLAFFFITGCAQAPLTPQASDASLSLWRGRLALRVDSDPPQSFFASFELSGQARRGELRLFGPLGNTLASLQWSPQAATLRSNGEVRQFDSLDDLAAQATGTALPIATLFEWLAGRDVSSDGWEADLSRLGEGRLLARRTRPEPFTELRLILEP